MMDVGHVFDKDWYREHIIAVYKDHNPAKLGVVDELLQKNRGHEPTLYEKVCNKYGVQPSFYSADEEMDGQRIS